MWARLKIRCLCTYIAPLGPPTPTPHHLLPHISLSCKPLQSRPRICQRSSIQRVHASIAFGNAGVCVLSKDSMLSRVKRLSWKTSFVQTCFSQSRSKVCMFLRCKPLDGDALYVCIILSHSQTVLVDVFNRLLHTCIHVKCHRQKAAMWPSG